MHITWKTWTICAVSLMAVFWIWGVTMGCHGDECNYNTDNSTVEFNPLRRQLGGGGPAPELDDHTAAVANLSFGILGWSLTLLLFLIAWKMEVQEEDHHFDALGLTEDDKKSGKKKKLTGAALLKAIQDRYSECDSQMKVLANLEDSGNGYTMPTKETHRPTITVYVANLPCGAAADIPDREREVFVAFEAAFGNGKITDVRVRVKPSKVSFYIQNHESCIKNDESCIENDESCIKNDGSCEGGPARRGRRWTRQVPNRRRGSSASAHVKVVQECHVRSEAELELGSGHNRWGSERAQDREGRRRFARQQSHPHIALDGGDLIRCGSNSLWVYIISLIGLRSTAKSRSAAK